MKSLKQQIRKLLTSRKTDIVAYGGAIFNQKGCPMVHWKVLCKKNQGPNSKDENVINLQSLFRNWQIEVMYAIKRYLLGFIGS